MNVQSILFLFSKFQPFIDLFINLSVECSFLNMLFFKKIE